jgi:hypothetical protein
VSLSLCVGRKGKRTPQDNEYPGNYLQGRPGSFR